MKARLRRFLSRLQDTFWLVPGALVTLAILVAMALVELDRSVEIPQALLRSRWLYGGGGTGARTLLGAIASSTIGVAGTAFSITIASLSLAAGQMGPRLLQNFTRDRGNQLTLGFFLGTFSYALVVLRSVRTQEEGPFTPHLALSFAVVLAFGCVGLLIYFVAHMAGRINVETVIELVSEDVHRSIERLTTDEKRPATAPTSPSLAEASVAIVDPRHGYLQQLDVDGLADWAASRGTVIHLLVRPGHYFFPGGTIARTTVGDEGTGVAIREATALSPLRASSADLESPIRQLVEVAVRALSPGINDPGTAISVLDRLGAAMCRIAGRSLEGRVVMRNGAPALVVPTTDYDGLLDSAFHLIRQSAVGSAGVLIRMMEVLEAIASCEHHPGRLRSLERHARLVQADGDRTIGNPEDRSDLRVRHRRFEMERERSEAAPRGATVVPGHPTAE